MYRTASFTHENSTPVEKRRNWTAKIISSIIGGTVAVLGRVAIAALMAPEEMSSMASTTITGIFWGMATKISGNVLGSDKETFILHQDLIQKSYRNTVEQHIGPTLETVATRIRTNSPFELLHKRVYFDVDEKLRFDINEKRRMFCEFSCKVIPLSGTSPRPLHNSIPAPELPNYNSKSTRTVTAETKDLVDGIRHGIQEGALLGLASGALASLLFLVVGEVGIFFGVMAATILVGRITHSAPPSLAADRAALYEEFSTEARHQMNRLLRCADDNAVGRELSMKVCLTTANPKNKASSRIIQVEE